ncbi:MAG: AMP-binding protein [Acidobacteria bacterium]|nr:AMP-binding protein [Acidobacteriota bacterium]
MDKSNPDDWLPNAAQIESANVTRLMARLGHARYEDLYAFSIREPGAYWAAVLEACGIHWSRPYERFADFSRGREFPTWFAGGRLNWCDTVFAWATRPDGATRTALIAEREDGAVQRLSYAELFERVRRFAGGLHALGIRKGDRLGLLMEPGVEAVVSMLGISYLGGVVLPLFSGFGAAPIAGRLSQCGASALVATTGFVRRGQHVDRRADVIEAVRSAGTPRLILKCSEGEGLPDEVATTDWQAVAAGAPAGPEAEAMASDDPFMVFFTSGTTGKPKGILHTHGGFPLKVAHDAFIHFDMKPGETFFWPADMGWIAGAMTMAVTMIHGAAMVCYDGAPDIPDWSRMSRMIGRHRITHFGAAPTMIRGFAAHPELATAGDLSSIRLLVCGGEAIDPQHFLWHQRHFGAGVAPLINFSGGTEASAALVSSVVVKPIPAGGFNTPTPGIDVDVVDASGRPVVGEVGELVVREPFVGMTHSFWQDDARYLETYWQTLPGIWVHGDLAERDAAGNFFVRGRSDDTLKLAGKRTGPSEIEDVLMEMPEVVEVAAIGVEDPAKGQVLVVFVIPAASARDHDRLAQAVMAHAERRLGRAFRPSRVHVVGQLPKTRTAKVMRRLIRAAYCGQPLGDTSSLENPAALEPLRALGAG